MKRFYHFRNVPRVRQATRESCWYAAAQMVVNSCIAGPLLGMGPRNAETFRGGLLPEDLFVFAADNHLRAMHYSERALMERAGRNNGFVFDDLVHMLSTYGPLWAPTYSLVHPCTLTGVEEIDDGTWIAYNDPLDGLTKRLSLSAFNQQRIWQRRGYMLHYDGEKKGITNKVGGRKWQKISPTIFIEKRNVDIPLGRHQTNRLKPGESF